MPTQARLQPCRPRRRRPRSKRACRRRVVSHRHSAQADEGTDEARRRPGHPRHHRSGSAAGRLAAVSASLFWGSWWCVPFFLVYGVLYGSASDSRWHECGHGTAFKTRWMNDAVYQIACFMIMRNPVTWRWSHTRHHTDTVIVGRDPEIAVMRPPDLLRLVLNFFGILDVWHAMVDMVAQRLRRHQRRGKDLHSRAGAAEGHPHRPHLAGDLCRDDRACDLPWARSCR